MGADVPIPPVALKMWELLDDLEGRGLLRPDATFEEFEALMEHLETTTKKGPEAP